MCYFVERPQDVKAKQNLVADSGSCSDLTTTRTQMLFSNTVYVISQKGTHLIRAASYYCRMETVENILQSLVFMSRISKLQTQSCLR
jgi:hypothetical protein